MTILVTGATGLVGRALIDELTTRGAIIRPALRGVEPDFDGVDAIFLHPRAVTDPEGLLRRARARGVRKVVALSAMNIDDPLSEQPSRTVGDRNREAELAAVGSGLTWTSLRPSSFAANAARAFGPQVRAGSVIRFPYARFEESPLHERDLAAVAASALLTDALDGHRVELTGPQSLSHAALADIIGQVLGRPLRFEEIPPDVALRAMTAGGMPEPFVRGLLDRYARHLDKPQHPPSGAVEQILGRPGLTFAQWVADNIEAFR